MRVTRIVSLGFGLLVSLAATSARADIPAGYKGTPLMGTPWPIPGRIDFENFDLGGQNVAWRVDDHTGNFGVGGCPGNNYRDGATIAAEGDRVAGSHRDVHAGPNRGGLNFPDQDGAVGRAGQPLAVGGERQRTDPVLDSKRGAFLPEQGLRLVVVGGTAERRCQRAKAQDNTDKSEHGIRPFLR